MTTMLSMLIAILLIGLSAPLFPAGPPAPDQGSAPGRLAGRQSSQDRLPAGRSLGTRHALARDAVATYRPAAQGRVAPAAAGTPRWQQQAELIAGDGVEGDHLGGPVALSGGTALVGAWNKDHGTGAAYVFVRSGARWTQQAKLTAGDGVPGAWFGTSVALSGGTALVGAPMAGNTGAAYVFVREGTRWMQQARLTARDGAASGWFGRTVALSEDSALVGAWYENDHRGAAYVFVRKGARWTQQARLTAGDGMAGDFFGTSVALSGGSALVGAIGKNGNAGAAYIFVRNGTRWMQRARLTARDGVAEDAFGTSVALSGATALVGAGFAHSNTGAAYVFVWTGTRWTQQAGLTARDGAVRDWFGRSVALHGDTALVGAWYANNATGAAYVFARSGTRWTQQARLSAGDGVAQDYFGTSVALSGGTGLVGAGFKNNATGAAYVFSVAP